jgi:hypothetical protein
MKTGLFLQKRVLTVNGTTALHAKIQMSGIHTAFVFTSLEQKETSPKVSQ